MTYRVKRAQEVLGHDLDDRRFALHTALALADELGDAVLLPHTPRGERGERGERVADRTDTAGQHASRPARQQTNGPADQRESGTLGWQTKQPPDKRS
ncbi:hypothetical protein NKH77_52720 [Streptomyces sp. M19]